MDKQYLENTDSDDESDLPEIEDFNTTEPALLSKSRELSFYKELQNFSNKSITSDENSPSSDENQNSIHFRHFHPIGEKFKKIKLKSVPIKVKLGIGKKSNWKLSNDYELVRIIGSGAYAEVWLGKRKTDESLVAIKIAKGTTSINLLKNEAEILKLLHSQYFPEYYDYGVDWMKNRSYLIMEYIEGVDLSKIPSSHGLLTNVFHYIKSLILAVAELHTLGIAHRDLKPENVIVTPSGDIKIIDFNISKHWKIDEKSSTSSPSSETSADSSPIHSNGQLSSQFSGVFLSQIGSHIYAAPEVLSKNGYSESVDIWGIGILILGMIKGVDLFASSKPKHELQNELKAITQVYLAKFSDEFKQSIESTLNIEPTSRNTIFELRELVNQNIE